MVDEPLSAPPGRSADDGEATAVTGRARREQSTVGLVVVATVAALLMLWLLSGRTPVEDRPGVDARSTEGDATATTEVGSDQPLEAAPTDRGPITTTSQTTVPPPAAESTNAVESDSARADGGTGTISAPLPDLDGWRLAVGDGHNLWLVDLGTGDHRRHTAVGAPIVADGDRLLMYQNSELFWLTADDLDFDRSVGSESLAGVPTLQVMFIRPRSADRPIVVDRDSPDVAVWWPNNNSDPQRWLKISLADGSILDSISLTAEVIGGPEVVATLGSGTFERVDGQWRYLGDLFASSVSSTAVLGRRCESPEVCRTVLLDRRTGQVRELDPALVEPTEPVLIADADRTMIATAGGLIVLDGDALVPLPGLEPGDLTANRGSVVVIADGDVRFPVRADVDVHRIDLEQTAALTVDLVPRWLVLMPPP